MSDEFTPSIRALLDRLEPPALPVDFADRLVARAEATPNLPPLPPYKRRHAGRGRRIALAVGVVGLVSAAAAAAVVPADVWRKIPVIGGIVELVSPAKQAPAPTPAERPPVAPVPVRPGQPEASPQAEQPEVPPPSNELPAEQSQAVARPSEPLETAPIADRPERTEPVREPLPVRELPGQEPAPSPTREEISETPTETAPVRPVERIEPVDETRQQVRERTTSTRQITPERIERIERRERRTSTRPRRTD